MLSPSLMSNFYFGSGTDRWVGSKFMWACDSNCPITRDPGLGVQPAVLQWRVSRLQGSFIQGRSSLLLLYYLHSRVESLLRPRLVRKKEANCLYYQGMHCLPDTTPALGTGAPTLLWGGSAVRWRAAPRPPRQRGPLTTTCDTGQLLGGPIGVAPLLAFWL